MHQNLLRRAVLPASIIAALVAVPAATQASTLTSSPDGVLTLTASPGESNWATLTAADGGRLGISDNENIASFPPQCEQVNVVMPITCPMPSSVVLDLGDADDQGWVADEELTLPVTVLGGGGTDRLKASSLGPVTLQGGDGGDELVSEAGGHTLDGGAGNDQLTGGAGDDRLLGGDGDDLLKPDYYTDGNDVVDGGAGTDKLEDWSDTTDRAQRPITLTQDGVANDGRTGETDNVVGVEVVRTYAGGTFTMTDGPDKVEVFSPTDKGPSTVRMAGGNDVVLASNGRETIDGGTGDDQLEGGFGDDVLTGGPGRDVINADFTGSQCGWVQSCTIPYGNDVIDARDGEQDSIDCGTGTDRVTADPIDVIAANCETVDTGGPAVPGKTTPKGAAKGSTRGTKGATSSALTLARTVKLRAALRSGLTVKVRGAKPRAKLSVVAQRGRRTVARGTAKAAADGTATVKLRFTKAARRALARKRTVKLTLRAGDLTGAVTLKR